MAAEAKSTTLDRLVLRSQISRVVREVAAKYAEEMLGVAVTIARNKRMKGDTRLKAVGMVLDRAAGKPGHEADFVGDDTEELAEQWRTAKEKAQTVMGTAPATESKDNVVTLPRRRLKLKD